MPQGMDPHSAIEPTARMRESQLSDRNQAEEQVRQIVDDGNQARKFLEVKRLREKLFNESR